MRPVLWSNRYVLAYVLLALAVALPLFLNQAKFSTALAQREQLRQKLVAEDLSDALESHLALGLTLENIPALRPLLDRQRAQDTRLNAVAVLDKQGESLIVSGSGKPELWKKSLHRTEGSASEDDQAAIAITLKNGFKQEVGWLVLDYDLSETHQQTGRTFNKLWQEALLALAGTLVLLTLALRHITRRYADQPGRNVRRIGFLLVSLLLVLLQSIVAWNTYGAFSRINAEDAPLLADTLARTLTYPLKRGLKHGIPLAKIPGVNEWLEAALDPNTSTNTNQEFSALAIKDSQGHVLFQAQAKNSAAGTVPTNYSSQLKLKESVVGTLVVGLNPLWLTERTRQLKLTFATLLIISLLLCWELLQGLSARADPNAEENKLIRLRIPLVLFFIGSELPRVFLPKWAHDLSSQLLPQAWDGTLAARLLVPVFDMLPQAARVTLPIWLFLLAGALMSPIAGRYSAHHGPKRLFQLGLLLALGGHLLALMAESLLSLSLARMFAGASFGCINMAAFAHISSIGSADGPRGQGTARYLSAYVTAAICGAGLGSLLHDWASTPAVFTLGLACVIICLFTLGGLPQSHTRSESVTLRAVSLLRLLRQPPFIRLLVLTGLPMQIVQQGLLFYWAPLALINLQQSTTLIGLMMMVGYFLPVLALNGPAANWAERSNQHALLVKRGLALTCLAALLSGFFYTPWLIGLSMLLIGVAWAAIFPAQGVLILKLGECQLTGVAQAEAIGLYRMLERFGSMLTPLLVALLIDRAGYAGAAQTMGALLLLGISVLFWVSRKENN